MQPWFEAVTIPDGHSCRIYDRRLPEFAFNWHYHPEYELTLTLGSHGTRFVGTGVAPYAEGDLALIGPNLPHAWQSHRLADGAAEHRAIVCWFTEGWIRGLLELMPELDVIAPLLGEVGKPVGDVHPRRRRGIGGNAHACASRLISSACFSISAAFARSSGE